MGAQQRLSKMSVLVNQETHENPLSPPILMFKKKKTIIFNRKIEEWLNEVWYNHINIIKYSMALKISNYSYMDAVIYSFRPHSFHSSFYNTVASSKVKSF